MIPEIKRILYTTDLSKNSAHAFRYAVIFSKKFDAEIVILHVLEEISLDARLAFEAYFDKEYRKEMLNRKAHSTIKRIKERLKVFCDKELKNNPECAEKIALIEVCKGYPEQEILKKANELNCDAILMGTHEKGRTHTFLGSIAKRVLRSARKPVFIIPLPKGDTDITFHNI